MDDGRIDVHGHLLPGVDDGCPTYEDARACARMLVDAGYVGAYCTPHVWPMLSHNNVDTIRNRVAELQSRLEADGVPLALRPGGELNLLWCWPGLQQARRDEVVTYNLAGRYALFDFWAERLDDCRDCLNDAVAHLQSLGLTLILAHPERIAALNAEEAAIEWFVERGVLLQLNTWCLTDPPGHPVYEMARRLLLADRYFLMGTDLHNAASMPNRIRGIGVAEKLVGVDVVRRLTVENPRRLWT
jgi:protein-tyrosine phosphatase